MSESETPVRNDEATPSVGMRLSQARQAQGLSLGEMARQLKLSVKQVDALERDDYRSFPGELWVRGFLRNYAKALGLNADQIIEKAGLASEVQGVAPAAGMIAMPADAGKERRRTLVFTLAFVVLGLFVLALLGQRATRTPPPAPAPVAAKTIETSPPPVQELASPPLPVPLAAMDATTSVLSGVAVQPALPAATGAAPPSALPVSAPEPTPSSAGNAVTPAPAASTPNPTQSMPSPAPTPATPSAPAPQAAPSPAPVTPAPTAAVPTPPSLPPPSAKSLSDTPAPQSVVAAEPAPASPEVAPPPKPRTLRFTFTQSVNVEVTDANGNLLLSKLQAAGTEKAVRGMPPFSVSVGNVHAVALIYRGRPVDLVAKAKSGAAKVTLK